jgi:hypothetical protein
MFLKIATVIAIVGIALSLLLSLIQQVMFVGRFYGGAYLMLSRLISVTNIFLFGGALLIFFVAFLLSLRGETKAQ